jgi:6-phosphofructokinase 1
LQPLDDIANLEHKIPRDWMTEDGFLPNEKFLEYARPLIQGEVHVPVEGGLPKYVVLERSPVEKKLAPLRLKRVRPRLPPRAWRGARRIDLPPRFQ